MGAVVAERDAGRRGGEGRHGAGRRDHRVQRPSDQEQRRAACGWWSRPSRARRVPVKVMRDKRGEDAQRDRRRARPRRRAERHAPLAGTTISSRPEEHGAGGFGLTLENVTPQLSRRLSLPSGQSGAIVSDVDPDGPSARLLRQGDVILSVNSQAGVERGRGRRASCRRSRRATSRRCGSGAATAKSSSPSGRNSGAIAIRLQTCRLQIA